jgi:hypothetical protein
MYNKYWEAMITQDNKKQLLLLREQIENCLFEKLSDDEEATKLAKDIFTTASIILQRAKNKNELIGVYAMICKRLTLFSYEHIIFDKLDLSDKLHKIALSLYECIEWYLPDSINETELAKSIWPYDINDVDSIKAALGEYILHNAYMFGPGYLFAYDFISKYEYDIKAAKTPREIMKVYNKIGTHALLIAWELHRKEQYSEAIKYDTLSDIIRFIPYYFKDLLNY